MPRETKAQRAAREAKERLAAAPEVAPEGDAPEEAAADEPPQPPEQNVVMVLVERDEAGNTEVDVAAQGDVRPTEVTDILILGIKKWKRKAGLTLD